MIIVVKKLFSIWPIYCKWKDRILLHECEVHNILMETNVVVSCKNVVCLLKGLSLNFLNNWVLLCTFMCYDWKPGQFRICRWLYYIHTWVNWNYVCWKIAIEAKANALFVINAASPVRRLIPDYHISLNYSPVLNNSLPQITPGWRLHKWDIH